MSQESCEAGAGQPDQVKVIIGREGEQVVRAAHQHQKLRELRTLKQHYYPEGGWGWVSAGAPQGFGSVSQNFRLVSRSRERIIFSEVLVVVDLSDNTD